MIGGTTDSEEVKERSPKRRPVRLRTTSRCAALHARYQRAVGTFSFIYFIGVGYFVHIGRVGKVVRIVCATHHVFDETFDGGQKDVRRVMCGRWIGLMMVDRRSV